MTAAEQGGGDPLGVVRPEMQSRFLVPIKD